MCTFSKRAASGDPLCRSQPDLLALLGCVDAVGENESLKLAVSNNPKKGAIFLTVAPKNSLKQDNCFHLLSIVPSFFSFLHEIAEKVNSEVEREMPHALPGYSNSDLEIL